MRFQAQLFTSLLNWKKSHSGYLKLISKISIYIQINPRKYIFLSQIFGYISILAFKFGYRPFLAKPALKLKVNSIFSCLLSLRENILLYIECPFHTEYKFNILVKVIFYPENYIIKEKILKFKPNASRRKQCSAIECASSFRIPP